MKLSMRWLGGCCAVLALLAVAAFGTIDNVPTAPQFRSRGHSRRLNARLNPLRSDGGGADYSLHGSATDTDTYNSGTVGAYHYSGGENDGLPDIRRKEDEPQDYEVVKSRQGDDYHDLPKGDFHEPVDSKSNQGIGSKIGGGGGALFTDDYAPVNNMLSQQDQGKEEEVNHAPEDNEDGASLEENIFHEPVDKDASAFQGSGGNGNGDYREEALFRAPGEDDTNYDSDSQPQQQQQEVELKIFRAPADDGDADISELAKQLGSMQELPNDLAKKKDVATRVAAGADAGIHSSLPSFEGTPMPKKLSFGAWRTSSSSSSTGGASSSVRPSGYPVELTSSTFLTVGAPSPGSGYVAACLAVRDAHDDISEWVRHHLKLGVFPIYVYDHASIPPLESVLQPYMDSGAVVYKHFETFTHTSGRPQLYAFDRCLENHGAAHPWMVFIDVDEFLLFRDGPPVQSLPALLQQYENYSALAVHWILFGSSGHAARPLQGALRSYTRCLPQDHTQHLFVKTIANTRCTIGTSDSPHSFLHNCSAPAVRVDGSVIRGPTADDTPVHSTLVIHHYATKSQEEFEVKMLKGSGMRRQRGWEYFYFVDGWSVDFNFDGLRAWDDDVATLPRTIDPQTLWEQLDRYASEKHEDFWGAQKKHPGGSGAQGGGGGNNGIAQQELEADEWGALHTSTAGQDEEDEDSLVVEIDER